MTDFNAIIDDVNELGFAIVPNVVVEQDIESIVAALARLSEGESSRGGKTYAARNLLSTVPTVADLASKPKILSWSRES